MGDVGKDSQGIHRGSRPGGWVVEMGVLVVLILCISGLFWAAGEEDEDAEILEDEKCI